MRRNAMKIVVYIVFCGTLVFVSAMAMAQGKTDEPQKGAVIFQLNARPRTLSRNSGN